MYLNHRSEYTVPLLFKPYFLTYFTPPDYPIYCKDGISPSFYLGLIFTSLIRCYKHNLFFQVLQVSRNFTYFCNWGINVVTVVLLFRSYSSLIEHSCFKKCITFNFTGKFSLNFNLSCLSKLSPPQNMAQTLLP